MDTTLIKHEVLLIAPLFFDYYKEIIKELENLNYQVTYICDAPSNSNISKAIGRINKNLLKYSTEKYYSEKVLPVIQNKRYEICILVAGMTFAFTPEMIDEIRKMNPRARFVMYQWDSEKNLPYSTKIHRFFDAVYSFDLNDCARCPLYKFLPLFYTRLYEKIGKEECTEYMYDCLYVGTAHPKKYYEINQMAQALKIVMPRQFIYHYMPSRLKYIYHKVFAAEYKNAKYSEFNANKLSVNEMEKLIRQTKCMIDAPQAGQTGLTIRTMECLGAKRKLITTNAEIKKYDFYNEANIYVFEENKPINLNSAFFTEPYKQLDTAVYEKYTLRSWIQTLLQE